MAHFARLVEQNFGLRCDGPELENLAVVLQNRVEATGSGSASSYLQRLHACWREESQVLASLVTVTESYFFRCPEHFTTLVKTAVPELKRGNRAHPIRILSAGCACGEEPFTVAIALLEDGRVDPSEISIIAFDLNPECIRRAHAGRFSPWSLRGVPERLIEKHFRRHDGEFLISDRIRGMVAFEERNLVDQDPNFWHSRTFDVIFCRNVLMYLSPRALDQVLCAFTTSLAGNGYLFLGHADSLHGISRDFALQNSDGAYYYRPRSLRTKPAVNCKVAAPGRETIAPTMAPLPGAPAPAAEKIAAIAPGTATERTSGGLLQKAVDEFAVAGQLSGAIRFSEAVAVIDRMPPERCDDPDVILLTAALLSERGKLDQAEKLCASLLATDNLNPAAHYLKAFCEEQKGGRLAAVEGYRAAIYIDPNFALPHLRLALALKRDGNLEAAHGEFEQALLLLGREDPARLLVFAGGFSRQALLDLCRCELRQCGSPSRRL